MVGKDGSQGSRHGTCLFAQCGPHKRCGYSGVGRSLDGETCQRRSDRRHTLVRSGM